MIDYARQSRYVKPNETVRMFNPVAFITMRVDKHKICTCIFITALMLYYSWTAHANSTLKPYQINDFLNLISNDWQGSAVQTPIGPVKYNIKFSGKSQGHVTGTAFLVRSTHYWHFYQERDQLYLEFLTTFAGNKEPILFKADHYSETGVEFNSTSREGVKVIIKPQQEKMVITIVLNDKAHVKIELEI